jgi:WD40 repeat protein
MSARSINWLVLACFSVLSSRPVWGQQPVDAAGDPLPDRALVRLGTTRLRHEGYVMDLAFAPDGTTVVSAGGDYNVSRGGYGWNVADAVHLRYWDPATGKELRRLGGHSKPVRSIAFAPDGKTLASAGDDGLVLIWDFEAGKEIGGLPPAGQSNCVLYLPDGTLATAGLNPDQAVYLRNAKTGQLVRELKAPEKGGTNALAVSPDGKILATGWSFDAGVMLLIWEVDSGHLLHRVRVKSAKPDAIWSLAFSPNGKLLASAHADQMVRLWDPASGEQLRVIEAKSGEIQRVRFSPDGKLLGTAGAKGLGFWDPHSGREVRRFDCPDGCLCTALAFSPGGKTLAWNCSQAVRLMDVVTGEELLPLGGHRRPATGVSFSPDGRWIASAGDRPRTWDAATGKERPLVGTASRVACVGYSADGKTLVAGSHDQNITLWDLESGKKTGQFTGETGLVDCVAFLQDGKGVISLSDRRNDPDGNRMEREARIWDVAARKQVRGIGPACFMRAALSADSRLLVSYDEAVPIWEVASGKKLGTMPSLSYPTDLALSPDGRYLAAVWNNRPRRGTELTIRETASGQEIYHWQDEFSPRSSVVLAFSDRLLAAGCLDGSIRLRVLETGMELGRLTGHRGAVLSLAFSPDGRRLVSGSHDTTALVWNLQKVVPTMDAAAPKPEKLRELWVDLAGDAPPAVRAIGQLARSPKQTVSFLGEQLQTGFVLEQELIAKLIRSLDDDDFAVREKASRELAGFGKHAEPALRQAWDNNPSIEARRRIERLLPKLTGDPWPPSDVLRILRSIEVLERIGSEEARTIIERLAKNSADSWTPGAAKAALQRLSRRASKPR